MCPQILNQLDLGDVYLRNLNCNRRLGRTSVAGLGRIYSCEGYDKLKIWEFEIYVHDEYLGFIPMNCCVIDNETSCIVYDMYLYFVSRIVSM